MVGKPPNSDMNLHKNTIFALLTFLLAGSFISPLAFSQDNFIGTGSFSIASNAPAATSPQDKLHALESTRFHFITLKQFHSTLFTTVSLDPKNQLTDEQARVLNAGLNSFLTQAGRETLLLEALRQKRSVRLKFKVPEQEKEYQIIDNPDRPLAYQLKPVVHGVPVSVEIKPLLDQPVAFEITLKKGNEHYVYDVDWSGRITCITCFN